MYFIPSYVEDDDDNDVIGARCVYWLMQTTTLPDALVESIKALTTLSATARDTLRLDITQVLQALLRPSIVDSKIQWGISTESLRSSLPELFQLLRTFEEFRWNDFLPPTPASLVKSSLQGILMKVLLSLTTDVGAAKWVSRILSLPTFRQEQNPTDLDLLHSFFIQNIPRPPSYEDLYTAMATICLHIKKSSPASEVAAVLGLSPDTLKEYISSLSLDVFFHVPTSPNEPITPHHTTFLSFVEDPSRCPNVTMCEAVKVANDRAEAAQLADLLSRSNWKFPDPSPAAQNYPADPLTNSLVATDPARNNHEFSQDLDAEEFLLDAASDLLEIHFFHWLEGVVLRKQMDTAIPFLQHAQDWLSVRSSLNVIPIMNSYPFSGCCSIFPAYRNLHRRPGDDQAILFRNRAPPNLHESIRPSLPPILFPAPNLP